MNQDVDLYRIVLLVCLVVCYFFFKHVQKRIKANLKGWFGEKKVAIYLSFLKRKHYKVFNDVMIRANGRTTQIDHVVISIYGVFVIETKNYQGWIHGAENSEYWTQSIFKKKTSFKNPIFQNRGHVRALKMILKEFSQIEYYPIIVFPGKVKLKNLYCETPVVYGRQVIRTIRRNKGLPVLSVSQLNEIEDILTEKMVIGRKARRKHKSHVRSRIRQQKLLERKLICPRCKGDLILRKGKHGKFYGCSNFPKCNYTRSKK